MFFFLSFDPSVSSNISSVLFLQFEVSYFEFLYVTEQKKCLAEFGLILCSEALQQVGAERTYCLQREIIIIKIIQCCCLLVICHFITQFRIKRFSVSLLYFIFASRIFPLHKNSWIKTK